MRFLPRPSLVGGAALALLTLLPTRAQQPPIEIEQLYIDRKHADIAAPESIVRDLRSSNEDLRQKALAVVGVPEVLRRKLTYENPTSMPVLATVKPEQIELRYAALGSGDLQQAILAIQVGDNGYVAIATPKANGWELVAQSGCWCKYDMTRFLDELVEIVQAPEPGRFELVLRASGGGSGLSSQNEAHFRLFRGDMKPVISFQSRYANANLHGSGTPPAPVFEIERRWFHTGYEGRGTLVEGKAILKFDSCPPIELSTFEGSVRDLESRHLGVLSCRPYQWNAKAFQYEPAGPSSPCSASQK